MGGYTGIISPFARACKSRLGCLISQNIRGVGALKEIPEAVITVLASISEKGQFACKGEPRPAYIEKIFLLAQRNCECPSLSDKLATVMGFLSQSRPSVMVEIDIEGCSCNRRMSSSAMLSR